jgi:membrane-bound hydrogenase subunit beta
MTNPPSSPETQDFPAERAILTALGDNFPELKDQGRLQRVRRLWVDVPVARLHDVIRYVKETLGFDMLCTITGTDEGTELGFLYHLAAPSGIVLTLVVKTPKDAPGPETVTAFFPLAELYERETVDLLGARIGGLPEGPRYPLPDDWPEGQYPLRKDWKPEPTDVTKEKNG